MRDESKAEAPEDPAGGTDYVLPAILSDEMVLFPGSEVEMALRERKNQSAVLEALKTNKIIVFVPTSRHDSITPGSVGTLALIVNSETTTSSERLHMVLMKGLWRIRVKELLDSQESKAYSKVLFERAEEKLSGVESPSLVKKVQDQIDEFVRLVPGIPEEIISLLKAAKTPGALADLCAYSPDFTHEQRVDLLRTLDQEERLEKVSSLLERQLVALRKAVKIKPISDCEKCLELADKAFEANVDKIGEIALMFLNHVVSEHTAELVTLLAEKYGPIFMSKRSLR